MKNKQTAQEMFEDLYFHKNTSECYNEQHILYEAVVHNDLFKVEFKGGYFVYTNLTMRAIKIDPALLKAINKQIEELGW